MLIEKIAGPEVGRSGASSISTSESERSVNGDRSSSVSTEVESGVEPIASGICIERAPRLMA